MGTLEELRESRDREATEGLETDDRILNRKLQVQDLVRKSVNRNPESPVIVMKDLTPPNK